jgi:hypothetical protein
MAAGRLSPRPLFRWHWKSLSNVAVNREAADWITRAALLAAVALAPAASRRHCSCSDST